MKSTLLVVSLLSVLCVRASVYELQLNVTTTQAKEATLKAGSNFCGAEGKIAYRQPTKMKIKAVVWGDGCGEGTDAVIWNETLKVQYSSDSAFEWAFLNRIGKNGTDAEGLFSATLNYDTGDEAGYLYGGATGKIKGDDQISLSGNFAGYMYAGIIVKTTSTGACAYCGAIEVTVLNALGWDPCGCDETDDQRTVAHGTWTLKYNGTATKKYVNTGDIAEAYKFPKYVQP